jgi:hypothetical protein
MAGTSSYHRETRRGFQLMRLIRRLLVLTIVGVAGVAAYAYWSDNGPGLREKAADIARQPRKGRPADWQPGPLTKPATPPTS